jgi:hypothetical protein
VALANVIVRIHVKIVAAIVLLAKKAEVAEVAIAAKPNRINQ